MSEPDREGNSREDVRQMDEKGNLACMARAIPRKGTALSVLAAMLCSISVAQTPGQGAPASPLTLRQAVELALRTHPDLVSANASKEAAREGLKQAESQFWPNLTIEYNQNWGHTTSGSQGPLNTRRGDLVLSYKLLDSGQREAQRQGAQAGYWAGQDQELDTRATVIENVATSFYDVLRKLALVTVADANVKRSQSTLDLVKAQVEAGTAAAKDIYQAQADFEIAKVALIQAQNDADQAVALLKQAIGIESDDALRLAPADGQGIVPSSVENLTSLKRMAFERRPDVAQFRAQVDRSQAAVRLARADAGPSLIVDGSITGAFAPNGSESHIAGLTLSFPIFDGGFVRSVVREAEQNLRAAQANLASKRLAVGTEVEQAYRNFLTDQAALPAAISAQKAAQVNYDAASEARREGVSSIIDVIQAQTLLVQADTNRVQAEFNLYSSAVVLARTVGRIEALFSVAPTIGGTK
ncbi:MAG: TolC family protein [Fimbriimonadales bacterium]